MITIKTGAIQTEKWCTRIIRIGLRGKKQFQHDIAKRLEGNQLSAPGMSQVQIVKLETPLTPSISILASLKYCLIYRTRILFSFPCFDSFSHLGSSIAFSVFNYFVSDGAAITLLFIPSCILITNVVRFKRFSRDGKTRIPGKRPVQAADFSCIHKRVSIHGKICLSQLAFLEKSALSLL